MTQNIFIGIIIALGVALALLGFDRYRLAKANDTLRTSVGIYQGQIQALNNDIKSKDEHITKQNQGLENLIAKAEERERKVLEAQAKARAEAKKNKTLSNELLLSKRKSGDVCKDTEDLINDYLKKRKG